MLRVDLRELARGPVETRGELTQDDPALAGAEIQLKEPVVVGGRLQSIGEDRFYWQGTATTVIAGECRRCLVPVATPLSLEIGALFSQDPEAQDDPDAYPVAPDATEVDVTPAIREELFLAAPRYVLCREDCKGLCPQCGKDLNAGPCGCAPRADARWQPLMALKDKLRSN
ncbi:MAG TPA: DUF177 domain-containing protein [Gemmatimonadales bacterium]|jgi:uncharacterized protein